MGVLFGGIKPNKFSAKYRKNIVNILLKNARVKDTKVSVFCTVLFSTERLLIPSRNLCGSRRDTYGVTCLKPDLRQVLYEELVDYFRFREEGRNVHDDIFICHYSTMRSAFPFRTGFSVGFGGDTVNFLDSI